MLAFCSDNNTIARKPIACLQLEHYDQDSHATGTKLYWYLPHFEQQALLYSIEDVYILLYLEFPKHLVWMLVSSLAIP